MTYGLQVYDNSGNTLFDSNVAVAGVAYGFLEVAAGSSATYTYPSLAGRSITLLASFGAYGADGASIDYALGYPRVTVTPSSFGRARALLVIAS